MYTWVIVINKTRKQKIPTQKNKETNKKSARKTSEEIVAEENNRQTDRQTRDNRYFFVHQTHVRNCFVKA
jgi:hypothetical protein